MDTIHDRQHHAQGASNDSTATTPTRCGQQPCLSQESMSALTDAALQRIAGGEAGTGLGGNIDDPFLRRLR